MPVELFSKALPKEIERLKKDLEMPSTHTYFVLQSALYGRKNQIN